MPVAALGHDRPPPTGYTCRMSSDDAAVVIVETFPAWRGPTQSVPLGEATTLEELLRRLAVPGDTEAVLVNGAYVKPEYRLQRGDRVTVIPFISGG
jgi:sulfur carrier protein ThiS